jgi:Sec7-like guanine-nucleotide exchange factor
MIDECRDPVKRQALKYYMNYFDFTGLRLDHAFRYSTNSFNTNALLTFPRSRRLCAKLFLRAETQQIDRILECFSVRFWECNPIPIYRDAGEP